MSTIRWNRRVAYVFRSHPVQCHPGCLSRRASLTRRYLHSLLISVIKLDGSAFEVQVPRTATVAKLIEAVKDVFDQSVNDDETISWSHVWGHFCLCYNGEKLLDNKAYIRLYGIKDGDQLFFVRHHSVM